MSTTPEQIDLWRQSPTEHQRLEFKEAKTQFDNRKLYEYCVAIANEGGGYLLLGVADKPPRRVVGTQAFNNPVQTLRERFHLSEKKTASISQIITAAIETGLIKPDEKVGNSRKFARYLPFWA